MRWNPSCSTSVLHSEAQIATTLMERIKPGSRTCPKPQASRTIGQCTRRASQNAQALVFQIMGKSLVRSRMGLTGLFWVVQLRFHFFLRRACYGAIL
jgi:hypothetical protein